MSDKILNNELKAEKQLLTLINATFHHELKNPLNSLICQRDQLNSLIKSLREIIKLSKLCSGFEKIAVLLEEVQIGFEACSKRIVSASKIIDYFIHDMLDYTQLCKDGDNDFQKVVETHDMRKTVNEIIEIQLDKIHMKAITIDLQYRGFRNNDYKVQSD